MKQIPEHYTHRQQAQHMAQEQIKNVTTATVTIKKQKQKSLLVSLLILWMLSILQARNVLVHYQGVNFKWLESKCSLFFQMVMLSNWISILLLPLDKLLKHNSKKIIQYISLFNFPKKKKMVLRIV